MTTMMKSLGIDQLTVAQRILLMEEIQDSISDATEVNGLSDAHRQDLQRRLDAHQDNPKAGSPWEEVKARLMGAR